MAIKLADTLAPMADFPAVEAKDVAFNDNKSLQEKYDNGELGGGSGSGEENTIESISVNGVNVTPDENKNVDIEVPNIYVGDTEPIDNSMKVWINPNGESSPIEVPIEKIKVNGELQTPVNKVVDITVPSIEGLTKDEDLATVAKSGDYEDLSNKPIIPSLDGYAKTTDIPTKVSQLENDSNYLSSIPEEYVTETELSAKGYLTEHQDISSKVDKVEGKSLISDTEIARLASVDNYDDTDIRTELAKKADATAIPSKVSELENDNKYQTESDVTTTLTDYATKTYVGEQIANAEHLKREIVTVLPSDAEASDNIIYMLKVESATGNDKYKEYMKIDGTVQMVGDTSVDLSDYATKNDIANTAIVHELTESEYNALSEAEQNNGDFYHIIDKTTSDTNSWEKTTFPYISDKFDTVVRNELLVSKDFISINLMLRGGTWDSYEWLTIVKTGIPRSRSYGLIALVTNANDSVRDKVYPVYTVYEKDGQINAINTNPPMHISEIYINCVIPRI